MDISVPRESHHNEHRVGLTPFAVARLAKQGHTVLVEKGAGTTARFSDRTYQEAGAQIIYNTEEVYKRADIICKLGALSVDELDLIKPNSIICAFHHLVVARRETVDRLIALNSTLIGYEIIRDENGELTVLLPMSDMAGQMAVQVAAHYLQNEPGGRGILMGNVMGVPPPTVLILGAGGVGRAAAFQAIASGAHVIILDSDLDRLRRVNREFRGRAVTVVAGLERLERYTAIADVVIGSVLIPGAKAPFVVTEEMVKSMKPGSVIIDVSIDQGGCIETSRPTTLDHPIFKVHDVVHYCVPNMTANIARTASRALANASLSYLEQLAGKGLNRALQDDSGLAEAVYLYKGRMVHKSVGETLGMPVSSLDALLNEGERS